MIRRNFVKALCASPLGFLVRKPKGPVSAPLPTVLADNGIPSWTTGTSSRTDVFLFDPHRAWAQEMSKCMNRKMDECIIEALL